jgi:hypothetical protein
VRHYDSDSLILRVETIKLPRRTAYIGDGTVTLTALPDSSVVLASSELTGDRVVGATLIAAGSTLMVALLLTLFVASLRGS